MIRNHITSYFFQKQIYRILVITAVVLLVVLVSTETETLHGQTRQKKVSTQKKTTKSTPRKIKKKVKKVDYRKSDEKQGKKILQVIDYGVNDERKIAINKILTIKTKSIQRKLVNRILKLLEEETNSEVLIKTMTVLAELKEKRAVPGFIKKIDHKSDDIQKSAVYGLKQLKATSSTPKLIAVLKKQDLSKDTNLTSALITTLGDFKSKKIIPFTIESIKDDKTTQINRENLVLLLGKIGSKEPKKFLIDIYKDEDENKTIRSFAVNSLANLNIKEAAGDIKEVLETIEAYPLKKRKKYYNLYIHSVAALAKMGDKIAVPKLMNSLRSNNANVRLKAVQLLKELKSKRTIDILKYKMEYDPSASVRKAAKKVLKDFGVDVEDDEDDKAKKKK